MSVSQIIEPHVAKLRKRQRDLKGLRSRIADELLTIEAELARIDGSSRMRRSRHIRPACGTDEGYFWHRYHDRDNWPLPKEDPCGCRAAHRQYERIRTAERRLAKEREQRAAGGGEHAA